MLDTASLTATALTTVFKNNKAASIAAAIINTAVSITKAIATLPPPYGMIQAGLHAAMGAAQIAAIKSTKMASGGSFIVPGGSAGFDSKFVNLNLAAGERVDVTPANQVGQRGEPRDVRLHFSDTFSREFWAKGIEQINALGPDGYRLNVAT